MDIIPLLFSITIPINIVLFLHHIYYSHNYISSQADKLYYFLTAIIPCAPAVMYSFKLIDYFTCPNEKYYNDHFLEVFFKTWVVSNPLLMINLGKLINLPLESYLILLLADIGIYMIGYFAYKTQDFTAFLESFIVAAVLFVCIMITLIRAYYKNKTPEGMSQMGSFYKFLSRFTVITWVAYPITFVLYKTEQINLTDTAITYICLDFLTKSVFSTIIIGYHRHLNRRKSMVDFVARRVIPLETILEVTNESETSSQKTEKTTTIVTSATNFSINTEH